MLIHTKPPSVIKCRKIVSKSIALRQAVVDDAAFILGLRVDPQLSRFISPTSNNLAAQQRYLEETARDPLQAYFVITTLDGYQLGCVRIYKPTDNRVEWGSWMLKANTPPFTALESILLTYWYVFQYCGFEVADFEVMAANTGVSRFHQSICGATLIAQDDQKMYFEIDHAGFDRFAARYAKFSPNSFNVDDVAYPAAR